MHALLLFIQSILPCFLPQIIALYIVYTLIQSIVRIFCYFKGYDEPYAMKCIFYTL
ncbi:hypothetical protein Lalb_Chr04g0248421 [Lupinus albus]|uniref:Uncharacterized protein n=1 Tax=Lupinus albus TaxID=3870 RepID=A0A6A4QMU1_LUPAL|nr:hypothetical protein Lalb_Chr04g0248421 [Lupinus albus]